MDEFTVRPFAATPELHYARPSRHLGVFVAGLVLEGFVAYGRAASAARTVGGLNIWWDRS